MESLLRMEEVGPPTEDRIEEIEEQMLEFPQADCPVIHTFGPGVYIRELRMKKGTVIIGREQRFQHMNIFLRGKVKMMAPDGSMKTLEAPMMFVGEPGRKMGYVLEDVVWLNIYGTDDRDVELLEKTYFVDSPIRRKRNETRAKMRALEYASALKDLGVTPQQVEDESRNLPMLDFPFGSYKIGVFPQAIAGRGIFATAEIEEGEIIAPAAIAGIRTPAGRFTNHSDNPNAKMVKAEGNVYLVALKRIEGSKGGDVGEEITTDYRETRKEISCQE